jgi:hypothetical protein
MKQEPELIDVFAMLAMMVILNNANKGSLPQDIARASYDFAEAMIDEHNRLNSEGKSDEQPDRYV